MRLREIVDVTDQIVGSGFSSIELRNKAKIHHTVDATLGIQQSSTEHLDLSDVQAHLYSSVLSTRLKRPA
ncbi:hypothetical protein VCRA2118O41_390002 [Vibrio crassostreae]|nr:hypothetical protein VCRA2118O41_390002 [Vibrio crassostreae]